jgi:ABC-type sulfate transport system substrate-binding protein
MKKDTAVRNINKQYLTLLETSNKLRDIVHQLDDFELAEEADDWCRTVEEFFDDGGSITRLLERIEEVYDID